jgi:hypothetical protein
LDKTIPVQFFHLKKCEKVKLFLILR